MSGWMRIEGETPIDDISGLRIRSVRTRKALHEVEADNIRSAVVKYMTSKPSRKQAPFELKWLKKLHKEMLGRVWSWAGQFRSTEANIGVPANQIEERLHVLLGDLAFWEGAGVPLIEQSAMLHHRAVFIHPFSNGNGRWSRLLANIWLKLHDHPTTEWPEETLGDESTIRKEYLVAIRAADGNDYGLLIQLHKRFTANLPKS